jgi:hypothetical protein
VSVRWQRTAGAAAIAAYFLYFARGSTAVKCAADDLMNLDYYWRLGWSKLLVSLFAPWQGGYRPLGGFFYLPLYRAFGLNPAPYHVVLLALLAANVWLVYRLARALGCPESTSAVAAVLVCYHGGLSFLYYNTSFIYDVLCCLFYLAALGYYVRRRAAGLVPARGGLVVFLALYWCALNAKEMALTMPGVLLAYEWTFQKRRSLRAVIWTALLAAPIFLRAVLGPGSLTQMAIYRPEFSLARVAAFQRDSLSDLFESWHFFTMGWVVAVWAALTLFAWWPKRPALRFCWWFVVLTPIPIELLEGRTNACLALPYCGFAILAAAALTGLAQAVSGRLAEPRVRRACFAGVIAVGVLLWGLHNARLKQRLIEPQMRALGQETWAAITALEVLHPDVRPHSTVIFLNDPFEDFDMAFIADLVFHQPGVNIKLARKTPVGPEELAKADHLFDYAQGRLIQTR